MKLFLIFIVILRTMMGESAPQGEFSIFTESHRIEKKDDPLKKNIDITTSQPVEMTNTKQSVTLTEDRPRENSKLIMMGTPLELNCFLYENQQITRVPTNFVIPLTTILLMIFFDVMLFQLIKLYPSNSKRRASVHFFIGVTIGLVHVCTFLVCTKFILMLIDNYL